MPDSGSETPGHSETGGQLLFSPSHPFVRSKRRRASWVSLAADGDSLFIQLCKLALRIDKLTRAGVRALVGPLGVCATPPPIKLPLRQPSNQLMQQDRCTVRLTLFIRSPRGQATCHSLPPPCRDFGCLRSIDSATPSIAPPRRRQLLRNAEEWPMSNLEETQPRALAAETHTHTYTHTSPKD